MQRVSEFWPDKYKDLTLEHYSAVPNSSKSPSH